MATKYRLGENLLKVFSQSVKDSKITLQESMLYVSQATNKYIRDLVWANKSIGELTVPYSVLVDYDVTAKEDNKGRLIAPLPIRTLETLHNNMGVFQVIPCGEFGNSLIPVNKGWMSLYAGRASYNLEGQLAYLPERDRLFIIGADTKELELTVTLIPDSTGLNPEDELPLPPDAEQEVIALAMQMYQTTIQLPQDVVNDNKYQR